MADYIIEPLDTDAEEIFQGFVDFIQAYFPDWQPSEGQLDVIIGRYFAMQTAFTADMASRVLRAIYRYFGNSLAGIAPLPGSAAIARIHFTIADPSVPPVDRLLPFGTQLALTDLDGDIQMFSLLDDLIILAGVLTGEVDAQATELGSVSNGISGSVQLVEQVDWISEAHVVGVSSGGSNPEEDEVYIQRLTENLALMAPRPILAEDFAVFAKNIPGVWRAAVIDNFRPGVNEVQRLQSNYTGGTFGLQWETPWPPHDGVAVSDIPWNATADDVRRAMQETDVFNSTDADFTGGPLPTNPITIIFHGKYGYTDVYDIVPQTTDLTGGSSMTITEITEGSAYDTDMPNAIAVSAVDEGGYPLSDETKNELIAYLASTRAQNFVITYVDPAYHLVEVTYTARALRNQDPDAVRTLCDGALSQYLSQAKWGVYPYEANNRTWILQPVVRYLELTTVVENVPGVDYVESLTFSLDGGVSDTSDKTFTGAFSLTNPGDMDGTINLPI